MPKRARQNSVRNLRNCWYHLSLLTAPGTGSSSRQLRSALLNHGSDCLSHSLTEIVYNLLRGNCPLNNETRRFIQHHKQTLLKIVKPNAALKSRRRIFQSQVGGSFFPALLAAALPVLVDLLFRPSTSISAPRPLTVKADGNTS